MTSLRRNARLITEGSIGVLLIALAVPAVLRALRAFNVRVLVGLFLFLLALVVSRDRQTFGRLLTLLRKKWAPDLPASTASAHEVPDGE